MPNGYEQERSQKRIDEIEQLQQRIKDLEGENKAQKKVIQIPEVELK